MTPLASSSSLRRVLIVRPSALGDVCRTVPALATLRRALPDARIDWLVQSEYAPAIASHPDLTEAVTFPRREFGRAWKSPSTAGRARGWLRALKTRQYDLVLDFQGLSRSGLMTWATRAPRRVGFRDARELAWLGYNVRHDPPPQGTHTVDRMLSLLEAEGFEPHRDMRLYASDTDRTWWAREHRAEQPYAVLAPTARWPSKRWPIERWRELIEPLLLRGFRRVVVIGAPGEESQVEPLVRDGSSDVVLNMVGRCTIGQTIAIVETAGLVIANDSAPLHMAVGLGTPCLGLFGPTDPSLVGPYRKPHSVLRLFRPKPDEIINYRDPKLADRLMRVISTVAVIQQLDRVLKHESPRRAPQAAAGASEENDPVRAAAGTHPILYLASASPRRRLLLNEIGLHPVISPPDIDDGCLSPGVAPPPDRVLGLAYLKARRVADRLVSEGIRTGIVLGADTLCVNDGRTFGQPRDADQASKMLLAMRNRTHRTITGVCLINLADDRRILFHDEAAVTIGDVSDAQIDDYIASGEWSGKAGAYNFSERVEAGWPIECEGDPATVMGLPIRRLRALLSRDPFRRSPEHESPVAPQRSTDGASSSQPERAAP